MKRTDGTGFFETGKPPRNKKEPPVPILLASGNAALCEPLLQYLVQERPPFLRLASVYAPDPAASHLRLLGKETRVKPLSGERILGELAECRDAVLLLDLDLPGLDSLRLVQELQRVRSSERVVVVSDFLSSLHKAAFSVIPIGYYMRLPVSPPDLCRRLLECGRAFRDQGSGEMRSLREVFFAAESVREEAGGEDAAGDEEPGKTRLKNRATQLLHEIGVPANLCGHEYLREAIVMLAGDCEVYGKMTKIVYPAIAKKYAKSSSSVEKAIRTALEVAWTRGKTELLDEIFGFTVNMQKGKPTNSEFIALLADYLWSEDFLRHSGTA